MVFYSFGFYNCQIKIKGGKDQEVEAQQQGKEQESVESVIVLGVSKERQLGHWFSSTEPALRKV